MIKADCSAVQVKTIWWVLVKTSLVSLDSVLSAANLEAAAINNP